jgi:histidinol-phosphate/aromatic aminotransferase/cobyric acid decarboxylase-like protein
MQGFLAEVCQRIIVDEAFFELAKAQPAQQETTP